MAIRHVPSNNENILAPNAAPTNESSKSKKSGKISAANAYQKSQTPNLKNAANVQISSKAREMNLAQKVAKETPDVNEARVKEYKDLIAQGKYKPNPGKIADGIAREALLDEFAHNHD